MIEVGISDLNVAKNGDVLITRALGSCVGICLYDAIAKVAGLSHVMLPDSKPFAPQGTQKYKFADTAIEILMHKMEENGAMHVRMRAKIAGGAQMFAFANATDIMRVGVRNAEAVKRVLRELDIRLLAEDTGGNYGRTVQIDLDTGAYKVKTIDKGEKEI